MTIAERSSPLGDAVARALPGHESYSSLTTYEACPRRYEYRYVERLPGEVPPGRFAFGSAVHRAFEVFVRERIRARVEGSTEPDLALLAAACDGVLERVGLGPDELARMRGAAGPVLERFVEHERIRDSVPVAVELGFGTDVALPDGGGSVRFVGYIDRVDLASDGSTAICDYKTGRPRPQRDVDADRQLTAYAYAAARGALRDPATGAPLPPAGRLSLYFAKDGSEPTTTRSPEELDAFEQDLVAMAAAARRHEFEARPDAWTCRWCEYRESCADAVSGA